MLFIVLKQSEINYAYHKYVKKLKNTSSLWEAGWGPEALSPFT